MKLFFFILSFVLMVSCDKDDGSAVPEGNGPLAGDWSSGGGENFGPHINPWFIQNTETVSYCLHLADEFTATEERVDRSVQAAIRFWQTELKNLPTDPAVTRVRLGTQEFQKVPCSQKPEITFQLGWLSPLQQEKIGDWRRYVGFAARTAYDKVQLRGSGFIYIALEKVVTELLPRFDIEDLWNHSDSFYLEAVLIHELGHVFGMTRSLHDMMRPLVWLSSPEGAPTGPNRFYPRLSLSNSPDLNFAYDCSGGALAFKMGVPEDLEHCIQVTWFLERQELPGTDGIFNKLVKLKFDLITDQGDFVRTLGEARSQRFNGFPHLIYGLFLEPAQRVFPDEERPVMPVAMWDGLQFSGEFQPAAGGEPFKIFSEFYGDRLSIGHIGFMGNFSGRSINLWMASPRHLY